MAVTPDLVAKMGSSLAGFLVIHQLFFTGYALPPEKGVTKPPVFFGAESNATLTHEGER